MVDFVFARRSRLLEVGAAGSQRQWAHIGAGLGGVLLLLVFHGLCQMSKINTWLSLPYVQHEEIMNYEL